MNLFYHKIFNSKSGILNNFFDLIFPKRCLYCQKFLENENKIYLCKDCLKKISLNNGLFCPICKKRLFVCKFKNSNKLKISKCYHKEKSYLDVLGAATNFSSEIASELIHTYKYQLIKDLSDLIASLIFIYLEKTFLLDFLLQEKFICLAVPLSRRKKYFRGFNQSALFGQKVSQKLNFRFEKILVQVRPTKDQTKLNFTQRKENVKGAFKVKELEKVKGKNIILFDDVYTTGATMQEIAKILKAAGAKKIIGLVFALG